MNKKKMRTGTALALALGLGQILVPSVSRAAVLSLAATVQGATVTNVTPATSGSVTFVGRVGAPFTPAKCVRISATDGTFTVSGDSLWAPADDPGAGVVAGDFAAELNLTPLGAHNGTISTLSVSAIQVDCCDVFKNIKFCKQTTLPGATPFGPITVTKESATPGDTVSPSISIYAPSVVPSPWCRNFILIEFSARVVGSTLTCQTGGRNTASQRSGEALLFGSAIDDVAAARGKISEIGRVAVKIERTGGTNFNLDPQPLGVVVQRDADLTRRGPVAFYQFNVRRDDLGPGAYKVTLTAFDALGNKSATAADPTKTFRIEDY